MMFSSISILIKTSFYKQIFETSFSPVVLIVKYKQYLPTCDMGTTQTKLDFTDCAGLAIVPIM